MADPSDDTHTVPARQTRDVAGEEIEVRQAGDDDVFYVRLPIATTGEVRNEGDEPLTRAELRGMAQQINERTVRVFPDHGGTTLGGAMTEYSIMEHAGEWEDAEVREHGESNFELVATARLADPESMPAAAGKYREMLTVLKEQARRGFSQAASIGWRDDGAYPGGVDLIEASLVGIGADPRTSSDGDEAVTLARAAEAARQSDDPLRVADVFRRVVSRDPDAERPLGPPSDPERFDSFQECEDALADDPDLSREDAQEICGAWEQAKDDQAARVDADRAEYEVGDTTLSIEPPAAVVNAAQAGLDAKDEYDDLSDCGTGVGEERARQLIADEVGPQVIEEVAAYLTSHEEDVDGISDPPTDWGEETWTDGCGPVQYALWGGTATGTGIEWAQDRANAVAEARDEELPYPDRAARNLDDPEFSEGDAVSWDWQGDTVHGRVADIGAQFTVAGNTITGDEGEAVYLIHDYDEQAEAYDREGTAKPESSLSESQMDLPPATEDNFMSANTDAAEDSGGTTDTEQDAPDDGAETRAPDDLTEEGLLTFTATHFDGMDESDMMQAVDAADASFIGECDAEALYDMVSTVTGAEYGTVEDAMTALMDTEQEYDGEMDDDEDDEQAADGTDEGRAADADTDTDTDGSLADEVQSLREQLDDVRERVADGDTDAVESPAGTDADAEDADGTEQRDTTDAEDRGADADGPAWRA